MLESPSTKAGVKLNFSVLKISPFKTNFTPALITPKHHNHVAFRERKYNAQKDFAHYCEGRSKMCFTIPAI